MRIWRRAALATAGLVAVAATTLVTTPTEAATSFSRISEVGIGSGIVQQPSIARFGSTYEVVWVHYNGSTYSLEARILSAAGAPTGSVITVVSGWGLIRNFPSILFANGQRVIAFAGYQNGGTGANFWDYPAEYYVTSSDGLTWSSPPSGYLSPEADVDGTVVPMGSSSVLTASGVGDSIGFQQGFSASLPTGWSGNTSATGLNASYPGIAVSGTKAWISWLSDSSSAPGVHVQPVLPSLGTRKRAPSSLVNNAYPPTHQRIPLVVRTGTTGPPYTAYARPSGGTKVYIWKYGATSPIALTASGATNVELTGAPGGRLWVFWTDSKGWHATRSNKAATHFGPVTTIGYPANANHTTIAAVGSAGPLEAVSVTIPSFDNTKSAIYAAQIKPRLSCGVSPTSGPPGTKIAVTVKDAGDPVSGATVKFAGKTGTTSSTGVVHFTIPSGPTGKLGITASHSGYTGCSTTVKRT